MIDTVMVSNNHMIDRSHVFSKNCDETNIIFMRIHLKFLKLTYFPEAM